MVLGVQWLELLGPCLMNFKQLTIESTWQGIPIKVTGKQQEALQASNPYQIHKLLRKDEGVAYFHMLSLTNTDIEK